MKKLILLFLLTNIVSCSAQKNKNIENRIIEVSIKNINKIEPNTKTLSNETGIKQSDLTSSLSFSSNKTGQIEVLPINDKKFNYEYFDKNIYPNMENKRVKLFLDVYKVNSKEVVVICKIE